MNKKSSYWAQNRVAVFGGGSWGTVLAQLASANCLEVRLWVRSEEMARKINSSKMNEKYLPGLTLRSNVVAMCDPSRIFEEEVPVVFWALPSDCTREMAKKISKVFKGNEILIHATKGIESVSMKRISQVLREEIPISRIGVVSGPNLAKEIADLQPAATVVASNFTEVVEAGQELLVSDRFRIYGGKDMVGVEWAGTLKNILAIASGAIDALKLGWNSRAMLMTRGLAEMVRFGTAMGAEVSTYLGLAGVGDLLATCSSDLSRNYRVGLRLAQGQGLSQILEQLQSTAEGIRTTQSVWEYATKNHISMPITGAVYQLIQGGFDIREIIQDLMTRPNINPEI